MPRSDSGTEICSFCGSPSVVHMKGWAKCRNCLEWWHK